MSDGGQLSWRAQTVGRPRRVAASAPKNDPKVLTSAALCERVASHWAVSMMRPSYCSMSPTGYSWVTWTSMPRSSNSPRRGPSAGETTVQAKRVPAPARRSSSASHSWPPP